MKLQLNTNKFISVSIYKIFMRCQRVFLCAFCKRGRCPRATPLRRRTRGSLYLRRGDSDASYGRQRALRIRPQFSRQRKRDFRKPYCGTCPSSRNAFFHGMVCRRIRLFHCDHPVAYSCPCDKSDHAVKERETRPKTAVSRTSGVRFLRRSSVFAVSSLQSYFRPCGRRRCGRNGIYGAYCVLRRISLFKRRDVKKRPFFPFRKQENKKRHKAKTFLFINARNQTLPMAMYALAE